MQGNHIDLLEFCFCSDLEFYEKHLADLPLEEQAAFMNEFPDFLQTDNVNGKNVLLGDQVYQAIQKEITKL